MKLSKKELQAVLVEMYPQPNYVWSYLNQVIDGLYPDEIIRREYRGLKW